MSTLWKDVNRGKGEGESVFFAVGENIWVRSENGRRQKAEGKTKCRALCCKEKRNHNYESKKIDEISTDLGVCYNLYMNF